MASAVRFYEDTETQASAGAAYNSAVKERLQLALSVTKKIRARLNVIDLRSYEPLAPNAAVQLMMAGAAAQTVQSCADAIKLLSRLPTLFPGGHHLGPARGTPRLGLVTPIIDSAIEGVPQPKRDRFCEDLEQTVQQWATLTSDEAIDLGFLSSTCESLIMELHASTERLEREQRRQSKWGMIAEAYDCRRKSQHALRASMTLAFRMLGAQECRGLFDGDSDVDSALQVRDSLLAFRRDMLDFVAVCAAMPDWELAIGIRDFRIRIFNLFTTSGYNELRPVDRYALNGLRDNLGVFVDGSWEDPRQARNLVDEVAAFCEPLVFINNRPALKEHDEEKLKQSRAALQTMLQQPTDDAELWSRFNTVLGHILHLRWRYEELDHLVTRERALAVGAPGTLRDRVIAFADLLQALSS